MIFRLAVLLALSMFARQALGQPGGRGPDLRDSNLTRPSIRIVARRNSTISGPIYIRASVGPQDNRRRWKIRGDYRVALLARFRRFR